MSSSCVEKKEKDWSELLFRRHYGSRDRSSCSSFSWLYQLTYKSVARQSWRAQIWLLINRQWLLLSCPVNRQWMLIILLKEEMDPKEMPKEEMDPKNQAKEKPKEEMDPKDQAKEMPKEEMDPKEKAKEKAKEKTKER